MCCIFTTLLLFGPRLGILIWWLLNPTLWSRAYDTFFIPLLGFIFLPWTTMMYVLVFPQGVDGFDWIWLGIAVLADLASYSGGVRNRDKVPGMR